MIQSSKKPCCCLNLYCDICISVEHGGVAFIL